MYTLFLIVYLKLYINTSTKISLINIINPKIRTINPHLRLFILLFSPLFFFSSASLYSSRILYIASGLTIRAASISFCKPITVSMRSFFCKWKITFPNWFLSNSFSDSRAILSSAGQTSSKMSLLTSLVN